MVDTPGAVRATVPMLGEHNARVFQELPGFPIEEIACLSAAGAIP
jgi:crotonobetainyl-CoA:carnitine CoA-transferase CaiB-like acyl-CoA transferase